MGIHVIFTGMHKAGVAGKGLLAYHYERILKADIRNSLSRLKETERLAVSP